MVFAVFTAVFLYYVSLILHLAGIIRIGKKKEFSAKYLIPFRLWFED